MAKANNFGVEGLKTGLSVVAGIVKTAFSLDVNGDGEVDSTERISFITSIIPQAFPFFSLYPQLKEEVTDRITNEEFEELVAHVQQLDFLPQGKDKAEQYVKKVILWINYNRRFIADSIELFKNDEVVNIGIVQKS